MDATTCGMLCQHPGCWATRRRQEKGLARSLPPLTFEDDSSDDEIKLPTQSVCNILEDYGESPMDRYPLSTGGRPTHSVDGPVPVPRFSPHSFHSSLKLEAPHNTTASILSKQIQPPKRSVKRNPRLRLVEVQEVFDRDDLRAQWDETFVTKQYYVWMPNPGKRHQQPPRQYKDDTGVSTAPTNPVLMKDLTECMIPFEIEQKREETVLFDEFPVLKKKQPRTRSPGKTPRVTQASQDAILDGQIDREGINELLALPKQTLMKVLEHTKKSDFTSPGRLHSIVHQVAQDDKQARLALGARHSFQHKELQAADKKTGPAVHPYYDPSSTRPVYQLDTHADEDHGIIDRLSSVNTPVKKRKRKRLGDERGALEEEDRPDSEADSVETFPRYAQPLPGIREPMDHPKPAVTTQRVLHYRGKIPSISLGLPELPSGIKTTKPFSYKRKDLDFSLGPVITPPSSYRSSEGIAYSDHGTTLKVNLSSTMPGMPDSHYRDDESKAIHSVSPALSTNVPVPPAGTPATFAHGSPTKSAPAGPLQQQYSWDTTRITINWSQSALPPSPGMPRGDSAQIARLLSTPQKEGEAEGLDKEMTFNEERALDTINETAREGPPVEVSGEITPAETGQKAAGEEKDVALTSQPPKPTLHLETSSLRRIGAGASPRQTSARSVESCPSPEQWPLISESSFENIPRPSVSEPALSARSDRRRPISRDNRRDLAARRAMDDSKMKTESPAPPPPSPEPKDHPGEARARKDLRSRDSLTMAPLFEVAELDEGSPRKEDIKRHMSQSSRAVDGKQSKKIEVTVPAEFQPNEVKRMEDKGGEMISQMTIMHVIPKGRKLGEKRGGELERVQETFLNVDIPAEDVSSVKAEHGSSHQEDISSNDTVVKSHTTGSEVSMNTRIKQEVPENEEDEREEEIVEASPLEVKQEAAKVSARDKSQTDVPLDSYRETLDLSNESLEMLCDSARFISHEQVSPVEGENEADSHRFVLGGLEGLGEENDDDDENNDKLNRTRERKESLLGNLTRRLDNDSARSDNGNDDYRDEKSEYENEEETGVINEDKPSEEEKSTEPPGVFFFQGSTPSEGSSDKVQGQQETAPNDAVDLLGVTRDLSGVTNTSEVMAETEEENTNTASYKEVSGDLATEQTENNIESQGVLDEADGLKDQVVIGNDSTEDNDMENENLVSGEKAKVESTSEPTASNNVEEKSVPEKGENEKPPKDQSDMTETSYIDTADQTQEAKQTGSEIKEEEVKKSDMNESISDRVLQAENPKEEVNPELQETISTAPTAQLSAEDTGSEAVPNTKDEEGKTMNTKGMENANVGQKDSEKQGAADTNTEEMNLPDAGNTNTVESNLVTNDEQALGNDPSYSQDKETAENENVDNTIDQLRQEPEGSSKD